MIVQQVMEVWQHNPVLTALVGLIVVYVLAQVMAEPLKLVMWLGIRGVMGAAAIILINLVGSMVQFHLGLNPVTAMTAGLLGWPGLGMLVAARAMIGM